jgi:hypothetical protein
MQQAGTMPVTFTVQLVCNPNLRSKQKSHPQGGFFAFWGAFSNLFALVVIGR